MALDLSISRLGITSSQLGVAITLAGLDTVVTANSNGDPIIADVTAETGWPSGATILTEQSLTISAGSSPVAATLATDGELTITGDWADAMSALLASTTYTAVSSVITLRISGEDVDARITFSVLGQNADPLTVVAAVWWDSRYVPDGAVDFFYDAAADVDVDAVNAPTASSGVITFDGSNDALQGSTPQFAHNTPGATYVTEYTLPDAQGSDAGQGFSIAGITRKPDGTWWAVNGGLSQDGEDDSGDTGGSGDVRQQSIVHMSSDFSTKLAEISTDDLWTDQDESPQGIAWDEANDWLWVLDPTGLRIRSVNEDGTLNASENITRTYIPGSVCMAEDGDHLWVMSRGAGDATIQKILTDGTKVVVQTGTVDLDDRHDHIIEYGGLLYISCGTNNGEAYVMVLDPDTLEVLGRAALPYPNSPNGLAGLEGLWLEANGKCYIAHNGYFHYGTAAQAADTFPRTNVVIEYTLPTIASEDVDLFWLGNPTSADYDMVFQSGNTNGGSKVTGGLSLLFNGGVSALDISKIYVDSSGGDTQRITGMTFGSDTLIYVTIRGTAVTAYQDGAQIGTATLDADGAGLFGLGRNVAEVGGCVTNSNRYFPGEWRSGGIIIGGGERQRVEGILAHRHGLTSLLPVDHPFKTLSPATPIGDAAGIETAIGTPVEDAVGTVDLSLFFTENTFDPIATYLVGSGSLTGSIWTYPTGTVGAISVTVTATTEGGISSSVDVDYTVSAAVVVDAPVFTSIPGVSSATVLAFTAPDGANLTSEVLQSPTLTGSDVYDPADLDTGPVHSGPGGSIEGGVNAGSTLVYTPPIAATKAALSSLQIAARFYLDGVAQGSVVTFLGSSEPGTQVLEFDRPADDTSQIEVRGTMTDSNGSRAFDTVVAETTVIPATPPVAEDKATFAIAGGSATTINLLGSSSGAITGAVIQDDGVGTISNVTSTGCDYTPPATVSGSYEEAVIEFVIEASGAQVVEGEVRIVVHAAAATVGVGEIEAEAFNFDGYVTIIDDVTVSNSQYSQGNPLGKGVSVATFTGATGNYDLTVHYRTDDRAGDLIELFVDDVSEWSYDGDGTVRDWVTAVVPNVAIANGDVINFEQTAAGPPWAKLDKLVIAVASANLIQSPDDPSDLTYWSYSNGGSYAANITANVTDFDSGTDAFRYESFANTDDLRATFAGATIGEDYITSFKFKKNAGATAIHLRVITSGGSTWIRMDTGAKGTQNSQHSTTVTDLGGGWYGVEVVAEAINTTANLIFAIAPSNGSFSETEGEIDLYDIDMQPV